MKNNNKLEMATQQSITICYNLKHFRIIKTHNRPQHLAEQLHFFLQNSSISINPIFWKEPTTSFYCFLRLLLWTVHHQSPPSFKWHCIATLTTLGIYMINSKVLANQSPALMRHEEACQVMPPNQTCKPSTKQHLYSPPITIIQH